MVCWLSSARRIASKAFLPRGSTTGRDVLPPDHSPHFEPTRSKSAGQSPLPVKATTMFDGLYLLSKYDRIPPAVMAAMDASVPRMLCPSGWGPKWAALAAS